ncbi:MAG: DUF736 domain-containing protein [Rhizobiales bacterium]|nr:DUF736 domain-containing protein [Hyphomicrobiales bacterium]
MALSIGNVTKTETGFDGTLAMLSLKKAINIVPNDAKEKDGQPDFRIFTDDNVEIGGGWNRTGKVSKKPYISLTFAAPELGPNKIYANLGQAAGQKNKDVFAILWNPKD